MKILRILQRSSRNNFVKDILGKLRESQKNSLAILERNNVDIENFYIGYVVGYVYCVLGGHRKTYFVPYSHVNY